VDGHLVTATDHHPFWVDDQGRWVDAQDLEPGDVLLSAAGEPVLVDAVRHRTELRRVHNLTVEGIHTYHVLVGDQPVLVHNCAQAAGDLVGPHGAMPRPRPAGMESHHGVNSVWAEANVPGYRPASAPAVLMGATGHNATRGVFNRWRSEIAARQGVRVRDIDWGAVSPGSAWRLAEEQFAAAGSAASAVNRYFAQWNRYIDSRRG